MPSSHPAVAAGGFIEYARVHANLYGTSIKAVREVSCQGKTCLLDIDVQGAELVKKTDLCARFLFIAPPSFDDLETRLRGRGTENAEQVADRKAQKFRREWKPTPEDAPDPDGFVPQDRTNLPRGHDLASDHAEELLLDSVRTLLCLHYETRLRGAERERRKKEAEKRDRAGDGEEHEDDGGSKGKQKAKDIRCKVLAKVSEALAEKR